MTDHHDGRRRSRTGIALTGAALGGVLLTGPLFGTFGLAKDLTPTAQAALKDVPGASVAFTGREATITGALTESARAAAIAAVQAVPGVRWATFVGADSSDEAAPSVAPTPASTPTPTPEPSVDPTAGLSPEDAATLGALAVLFEPDSANITPESAAVLDRVAVLLESAPAVRVELTGHSAMATLPTESEIAFSRSRAQAAVDYLVAHGIDASRLSARGAGVEEPEPGGLPANRSVTFTQLEGTN